MGGCYASFFCRVVEARIKNMAEAINEDDSLPDMRTLGVTSWVSDSGMIRYKIVTEEWLVYSKRNPPFWAFEKGVYLEKFDTLFPCRRQHQGRYGVLLRAEKKYGSCVETYIYKVSAEISLIRN